MALSKQAHRAVRLLRTVEKIAGIGHWYLDRRINSLLWSEEVFRIHGYEPRAFQPTLERAVAACHPEDRERFGMLLNRAIESQQGWSFELRLVRPDGAVRCVNTNGEVELDDRGVVAGLFGTFQDITQQKAAQRRLEQQAEALEQEVQRRTALEAELRRQALTDELTGVPNRRHFMTQAALEIARSGRYARRLSLVSFDLDRFKAVNDTFGHAAGDLVIKEVAASITAMLRGGSDLLGRLGGEEFVVLLPETSAEAAMELAERMRAAVHALDLRFEGHALKVTCSFGVCEAEPDETGIDSVLARADRALYEAKSGGRDRVCRA